MIEDNRSFIRKYMWMIMGIIVIISLLTAVNVFYPDQSFSGATGESNYIYPFILDMLFAGFSVGMLVGVFLCISSLVYGNNKSGCRSSSRCYSSSYGRTVTKTYSNPYNSHRAIKVVVGVSKGADVAEMPSMTLSSGDVTQIRENPHTTNDEKHILNNPEEYDFYWFEGDIEPKSDVDVSLSVKNPNVRMGIWRYQ